MDDKESFFKNLDASPEGLSDNEVQIRVQKYGKNEIHEKKRSFLWLLLQQFFGPIPVMIEIAALLSAFLQHWPEFYIILVMLLVNSLVRFYEEHQAGNAIEALKKKLAVRCLALRNGKWQELEATEIVPGDILRLTLGNIIPADGVLFKGKYLDVDQSMLTGESLPQTKKIQDIVYSGSIVQKGEMQMVVKSTGMHTYFGKTITLVKKAHSKSHFQKAILTIGKFLITLSCIICALITTIGIFRGISFFSILEYILLLFIASIPVALPAVLSVTLAIGAIILSRMNAIVSRLESIEEMAGIDVLCTDKTGTLTQNILTLSDPYVIDAANDPIFYAALASETDIKDPIDQAILQGIKAPEKLKTYRQINFTPFDPVSKKTEAEIEDEQGNRFFVAKGACQSILELCGENDTASEANEHFGEKGFRTIAVAKKAQNGAWQFLGLLPLFDPLRDDAAETIEQAKEHGLDIKMLTGDNKAIAKQIAKNLHLQDKIIVAQELLDEKTRADTIEKTTTFCEIFPEHKYTIVQLLQQRGHLVGMTGDGVNDAPALKQADVGIAVQGATDAAREAASFVLLAPGIKPILQAINEAKKIFERMKSYAIYRIAETIRIIVFIALCILALDLYPITGLMIILLALLNDLPIMAIVYDNTLLRKKPVRWQMKEILAISSSLGFIGILSSFLLVFIAKYYLALPLPELQSFIFLKLSFAGHLTLFAARTRRAFFKRPFPSKSLLIAIIGTQLVAMCIVGFGIVLAPVSWGFIGLLYLYAIAGLFITDACKCFLYRIFPVFFDSKAHQDEGRATNYR